MFVDALDAGIISFSSRRRMIFAALEWMLLIKPILPGELARFFRTVVHGRSYRRREAAPRLDLSSSGPQPNCVRRYRHISLTPSRMAACTGPFRRCRRACESSEKRSWFSAALLQLLDESSDVAGHAVKRFGQPTDFRPLHRSRWRKSPRLMARVEAARAGSAC